MYMYLRTVINKKTSGSVCQWYGSADPDPYQDIKEPQQCKEVHNLYPQGIEYLSRLLAGNAGLAEVNLLLADVAQSVLLRLHLLVDELGEAGPNVLHQAWGNKRNIIIGRLDCHWNMYRCASLFKDFILSTYSTS